MMESPNDVLACLVGECCWYCGVGSGLGGLTIKLGRRIEIEGTRSKPLLGEYMLWIQSSAWRVESGDRVIGTDADPEEEASWTNHMEGKKVVSIQVVKPAWDLIVEFEEHLRLRVFCNPPDTGDPSEATAWSCGIYSDVHVGAEGKWTVDNILNHRVVRVGPRGKWSADRSFTDWSGIPEPGQARAGSPETPEAECLSDAQRTLERIEDLIHDGEYSQAWALMDELATQQLNDDEYAELMYWRSSWYKNQDRYADVEQPIRDAIGRARDPGLRSACRRDLAAALVFLERYEEALEVCQEALQNDPAAEVRPYLIWWQASAYDLLGHLDEAVKSYLVCLDIWGELDDESFGVYIALLDIATRNQDWAAAWTYARKARAVLHSVGEGYDYFAEWTEQLVRWEDYLREVLIGLLQDGKVDRDTFIAVIKWFGEFGRTLWP